MMIGGGAALSALAGAILSAETGPYPLIIVMLVSCIFSIFATLYVIRRSKTAYRTMQRSRACPEWRTRSLRSIRPMASSLTGEARSRSSIICVQAGQLRAECHNNAYVKRLWVTWHFLLQSSAKQWEYSAQRGEHHQRQTECGGNKPQSRQQRGHLCLFPSVSPWQFPPLPWPFPWALPRRPAMAA
jgi:hypothetical protein